MLIYFAILALASAATIHDNRLRVVSPIVARLNEQQTPVRLVQLMKSPVQSVYSPVNPVQLVGQNRVLSPLKLQQSVISVDPTNGQPLQVTQLNDRQVVFGSVQPLDQQIGFLSTQPQFDKVQQFYPTVGRVQPIDVQKQIIYQSVQPLNLDKQIVTVVRPELFGQSVQNLRIGTSVVQPLQYSNVVQSVEHRDSIPTLAHVSPSLRLDTKGGHQLSYFVRGSDVVTQEDVSQVYHPQVATLQQQLEPPHYSSVSVLEPQVSDVREMVQPKIRTVGLSDLRV